MRAPLLGDVRVALVTSACGLAGTIAESRSLPGGLLAFSSHCALSNAGALPAAHAVYDFAWSGALPLSLAFAVLSSACEPAADAHGAPAKADDGALASVGVSFALASVASIVGVLVAFALALGGAPGGGRALPRALGAQVAGAVTATYVGGSANFAQVAQRVGLPASVLGALAACDIATMGFYFATLAALARSRAAQRWLEGAAGAVAGVRPPTAGVPPAPPAEPAPRAATRAAGAALALACAALALGGSRRADVFAGSTTLVAVGLSCALGVGCARLLPRALARALQSCARALAPLCLNFFYAAVGASARPAEMVGAGSAGALFLTTALAVHGLVLALGAWLLNRLPALRARLGLRRPLRLREVLIGSNAAIGGPSTAAAFAAPLDAGLVVPAAIWGVVGYGVGTSLGVGVWRALR